MSDAVNDDGLDNFRDFVNNDENSTGFLRDDAVQTPHALTSFYNSSKTGGAAKDAEFFKNNPEFVEFCDDIFNACTAKGMPYNEAFDKALECAAAFVEIVGSRK